MLLKKIGLSVLGMGFLLQVGCSTAPQYSLAADVGQPVMAVDMGLAPSALLKRRCIMSKFKQILIICVLCGGLAACSAGIGVGPGGAGAGVAVY